MVASAAILQACDALDGLIDGIVDNYHACSNRRVYAALDEEHNGALVLKRFLQGR